MPVDVQVLPLSPPQRLQAWPKARRARWSFRITLRVVHQPADPPHRRALLRPRRERPRGRRATEQRDEFAPLHSITSSARASSTAHRGNRASLWNWLELQFVGGRIDEPEFGAGLLRNRSVEKRGVFVGVRPVLPIAHSAAPISDLIAEAILPR